MSRAELIEPKPHSATLDHVVTEDGQLFRRLPAPWLHGLRVLGLGRMPRSFLGP